MQNKTRHAPATAMSRMYSMRDSEMIMRVSNAWNREIESERERRRHSEREKLRIQLWRSPTTSMHEALSNLYSSTVHHAVPRLRIILDYARSCINACILSVYYATYATYASTKWTRRDVWWEVVRGWGGTCFWGGIHSWIQGCDEFMGWILRCGWMVGRSS